MRILADENFPGDAVAALRERGHDVAWIRTIAPGINDIHVILRAQEESRLLVTFDKDFGELVYLHRFPVPSGIVLFRISPSSPQRVAQIAVGALESRDDWAEHFTVIEDDRIRMTPLPSV